MNKMIHCLFLNREAEKQDYQVFPGKIGKFIYENISKIAWRKWQEKQTILINEMELNMMKYNDRKFLKQEMIKFLFKNRNFNF